MQGEDKGKADLKIKSKILVERGCVHNKTNHGQPPILCEETNNTNSSYITNFDTSDSNSEASKFQTIDKIYSTQDSNKHNSSDDAANDRMKSDLGTSDPKLHQPTLDAIKHYLHSTPGWEEFLEEENPLTFYVRIHKKTIERLRSKVRPRMMLSTEGDGTDNSAEYNHLYNRIHSQEEFIGVASYFFQAMMHQGVRGSSGPRSSIKKTFQWVKNAAGMHRRAHIHADDLEDEWNEDDMKPYSGEIGVVLTKKGEIISPSRRSNRVRVMNTKKKLEKEELRSIGILTQAAKELEQEMNVIFDNKIKRDYSKSILRANTLEKQTSSKIFSSKNRTQCRVEGGDKMARTLGLCFNINNSDKQELESADCFPSRKRKRDCCAIHASVQVEVEGKTPVHKTP